MGSERAKAAAGPRSLREETAGVLYAQRTLRVRVDLDGAAQTPGGAARDLPRRALALSRLEFVPAPQTIIAGIEKLPPATLLTLGPSSPCGAGSTGSSGCMLPHPTIEAEAAARVRELLDAAVKRRLMSDVPLGVFVSGGLDSSAIVASMAALGVENIRSFSIGFDEGSF